MGRHKFETCLKGLYLATPCQVLPNSLWKTTERLSILQCSYSGTGADVTELKAWDRGGLYVYWNKSRKIEEPLARILEQFEFMIIHDDYAAQLVVSGFSQVKRFFRMMHGNSEVKMPVLDDDFEVVTAEPAREAQAISVFIAKCYPDLRPSPSTVASWTTNPVFEQDLWIWIKGKNTGGPVALGIAERDGRIPEGSLEWIQVLPEYRGRGLGKALVLELLKRLQGRVRFTTVSGELDNRTSPERLYRSCGFTGNDIWWLLRG